MNKPTQSGLTLIELSVVLLILVALAGLGVPYVIGTSSKALCETTDLSMLSLKKIIMDRYYLDTLGRYPKKANSGTDFNLTYLISRDQDYPWPDNFNIDTKTGWNGPYVQNAITLGSSTEISDGNLDSSFTNPVNGYVHSGLANGQSVILDGWGRPIIIQVDTSSTPYQARLISAGAGSGFGLGDAKIDTTIFNTRQGDDRILNLTGSTQANPTCD